MRMTDDMLGIAKISLPVQDFGSCYLLHMSILRRRQFWRVVGRIIVRVIQVGKPGALSYCHRVFRSISIGENSMWVDHISGYYFYQRYKLST